MIRKISKPIKAILCGVIIAALSVSCALILYTTEKPKITSDINKMIDCAKEFYKKGDKDNAYYQMQLYCQERPYDREALILLGDWYADGSDRDNSLTYYKKAAKITECAQNQIGESNPVTSVSFEDKSIYLKIAPDVKYTKNMVISFTGENLAPEKSHRGYINNNSAKLCRNKNYSTTSWFPVDSSQKQLTMQGGFNCATWQFCDRDKSVIGTYGDEAPMRKSGYALTSDLNTKNSASVDIPAKAAYARVTYADYTVTDSYSLKDSLTVSYGAPSGGYTNYSPKNYKLPDLEENQYVEYKDGRWTLHKGKKTKVLNLGIISGANPATISVKGDLCGLVTIKGKDQKVSSSKNKEYGIKYKISDGNPLCQRIGDSANMNFNYTVGGKWVNEGENDFDNAYPWCEMKLCNVSTDKYNDQTITYYGSKKFKTDGSNGNVMVEIPKFYSKREVKDGYEYLWISGEPHRGYTVDPAFTGRYGGEFDYIYVGAYLSSLDSGNFISASGKYPAINLAYEDIIAKAENVGYKYSEINYLTYNALQRLFVIETGTIDSSSLFTGDTVNYHYASDSDYAYALESKKKSNTIKLEISYLSENLLKTGDSISILGSWEKYSNSPENQREIKSIKKDPSKGVCTVTFSGSPIDIVKGKSAVTNIPRRCGKTDSEKYLTGTEKGEKGKSSFKYRGIENLYGSAMTALDGAYVLNGSFYYANAAGNITKTSVKLPVQTYPAYDYAKADIKYCIKTMAYDKDNPLVLMPQVLGSGASTGTYYGDFWQCLNKKDIKYYISAGGNNISYRESGIFAMNASIGKEKNTFMGSRLIYR